MTTDHRRNLPSVDCVLQALNDIQSLEPFSHDRKVGATRAVLDLYRSGADRQSIPSLDEIVARTRDILLDTDKRGLRRVVNGSGVVLHTGLGRAVLAREAVETLAALDGCCSLQIDLEEGVRGRRDAVVEELLHELTGAEAATVVNNNAAATLLVLAALCGGREVIVSRGQLIEIGGSFRLPDVIRESGARMIEVGTTNKTHLRDYETAITEETSVLLRVNPSNYRIVGFTQQVSVEELCRLKQGRDLSVVDDLGCGALVDLAEYGLPREPTVRDSLAQGADVALFSGDKLIGGPQCGIIVGRKDCISRIRKHPLARALRVGKLTVAALEATLKLFLNPDTLLTRNPTLQMLTASPSLLHERAQQLAAKLLPTLHCEVVEGESVCGGGALPDTPLETALVALRHEKIEAGELARRLRKNDPPILTRVQDDAVQIDVRTLLEGDAERIEEAVRDIVRSVAESS